MAAARGRERGSAAQQGGLLAGGGWLLLAAGAVVSVVIGSVAFLVVLGLLGTACGVVGCHLLARGKASWVYPASVFSGLAIVAALGVGGRQLALQMSGTTATCAVTKVERGLGGRRTGSRIRYVHTVACPGEVHTMSARPPYSAGDRVEVTYDPRSRVAPQFTDRMPARARLVALLALAAAGALTVLVLPFTAWRRGRRWSPTAAEAMGRARA